MSYRECYLPRGLGRLSCMTSNDGNKGRKDIDTCYMYEVQYQPDWLGE